jgi:hypothetical protein
VSCFLRRRNSHNICQVHSLGSLLVIFLVECKYMSYHIKMLIIVIISTDTSTSYVDYLQSKPSAPSTPIASVRPSRPTSLKPLSRSVSYENVPRSTLPRQPQQTVSTNAELATTLNTGSVLPTETTPLRPSMQPTLRRDLRQEVSTPNIYLAAKSLHSRDHSPHRCHHVHHIYAPIIPPTEVTGVPIDVLTNSPRIFRQLGMSHSHSHEHIGHSQANEGEYSNHHHHDEQQHLWVRRRRQIVGLLVGAFTSIECLSDTAFSTGLAAWHNDTFPSHWTNSCRY